jgi:hypothetical protein
LDDEKLPLIGECFLGFLTFEFKSCCSEYHHFNKKQILYMHDNELPEEIDLGYELEI